MSKDEKNTVIKNSQTVNYGSCSIYYGMMKEENSVTIVTVPEQRLEQLDSADNRQSSLLNWFDDPWPAAAGHLVAVLLAVLVTWGLMLVNVSTELMAVPGGSLASIFLLYVISMAAGQAVGAIAELPPLLGMMVAGIVLQNCGLYTVTTDWCVLLVAIMREAALAVILVKGGLELNADQLLSLSSAVISLAFLPCIAEAVAAAVAAHYIMPNFSWEWGLTLGFTLSAVSPAVLVPSLSRLKRMGYGENGVNTLVIAASSLDDIVSISAFGVLLGIIFSTGDLTSKIVQGPEDVCIGIAMGLVWGFLLIFIPPSPWAKSFDQQSNENQQSNESQQSNKNQQNQEQMDQSITTMRSFLLGVGGFLAVTGSQHYGYPGAGPLACIISAFVAGTGWKWRVRKQRPTISSSFDNENHSQEDAVEKVFECIWFGLQPMLFASIGTEIKFELLKGGDIVVAGLLVLVAGLIVRLIITSCAVWSTPFNYKEVIFINIAWLPKATVQAALAPVALDMARRFGSDEDKECATRLLTISVISILVTAPIGALGIQWFGPKLLYRCTPSHVTGH